MMAVENKKHVISTRTNREEDAVNAMIIRMTVARGKMVKTYAMNVEVFAKIHASLAMSWKVGTAIKKHLNSNAHARQNTGTKYMQIIRSHMMSMVSAPLMGGLGTNTYA